jgi:RNA polymerase-binding transcription factor DksA
MRDDATSHHYIGFVADNTRPDEPSIDDIERDLADVEAAMTRLESGTYWTCEVTGQPIPDEALDSNPLIRRLPS